MGHRANSALPWIRWALVAAILTGALSLASPACPAAAQGSTAEVDYASLSLLAPPWPCGQAVRVTWCPEDHWANGGTRGAAFDFSMPEGTPLYAPASGVAYFFPDENPGGPGLGNYVEIILDDRALVRLAHLMQPQSGKREVYVGEFIGHSGASGATAAHLHLEIMVREGDRWVAPDLGHMDSLFGLPLAEIVTDSFIVNDSCAAGMFLDGPPRLVGGSSSTTIPYGEPASIVFPLRNGTSETVTVDRVGLALSGPGGRTSWAVAEGPWEFEPGEKRTIGLEVHLYLAGTWHTDDLIIWADGMPQPIKVGISFAVGPPPVALVGLSIPSHPTLEEPIALELWLENQSDEQIQLEQPYVCGMAGAGQYWEAGAPLAPLAAGETKRVVVEMQEMPLRAGIWIAQEVGYRENGQRHILGLMEQDFQMYGPELVLRELGTASMDEALDLLLTNAGTDPVEPQSIVIWVLGANGRQYPVTIEGQTIANLAPREDRRINLPLTCSRCFEKAHVVDAGYWIEETYYPIEVVRDAVG